MTVGVAVPATRRCAGASGRALGGRPLRRHTNRYCRTSWSGGDRTAVQTVDFQDVHVVLAQDIDRVVYLEGLDLRWRRRLCFDPGRVDEVHVPRDIRRAWQPAIAAVVPGIAGRSPFSVTVDSGDGAMHCAVGPWEHRSKLRRVVQSSALGGGGSGSGVEIMAVGVEVMAVMEEQEEHQQGSHARWAVASSKPGHLDTRKIPSLSTAEKCPPGRPSGSQG